MSNAISTPYFLVDETRLVQNLEILRQVADQAGCKILLAQKAFSMFSCYPLLRRYLVGSTASGLYEARLGREHFGGETHVFSPAYKPEEFEELLSYADHFVFNSPRQLQKFGPVAKAAGKAVGLRVNPECSTQEGHAIYDPCAPGSRLGTTLANFDESLLPLLDGLHFHTLCEQNSDDLETTVAAFEEKFGKYLHGLKWINLGGGHHITRKDYDRQRLVRIVKHLKETYQVEVYLEPGEAVVLNAGFLVTSVLETLHNGMDIAILDTSAACHMPDVLEMPYRPPLQNSGESGEKAYTYRLGGPTCLAGDVIGDYSFDAPLNEGDRLVFEDMALYTMVKTNTFNGMPLPAIVWRDANGQEKLVKAFGYEDFKNRLS
ncbi:carboxynorspermidine decarboxylase [Allofournierella massiliensis]|uniref:Carboxynorspermidine decarboxylase n=1 Tax=Allofournierella massiliensis TaxID=1650663 RepID=A0A4V2QAW8_9FIRM|nr:carboxynorspermidine decarboxylase [Fournierella massiliensis]TCL54082.1 carboxynorspermidine decarboxylase [Fournierella massiliensis]